MQFIHHCSTVPVNFYTAYALLFKNHTTGYRNVRIEKGKWLQYLIKAVNPLKLVCAVHKWIFTSCLAVKIKNDNSPTVNFWSVKVWKSYLTSSFSEILTSVAGKWSKMVDNSVLFFMCSWTVEDLSLCKTSKSMYNLKIIKHYHSNQLYKYKWGTG